MIKITNDQDHAISPLVSVREKKRNTMHAYLEREWGAINIHYACPLLDKCLVFLE